MSALTPQIKSHKAMERAFLDSATTTKDPMISSMCSTLAAAHRVAAEALEAGEDALKPPREGLDQPIEFNRRGTGARHASER